MTLFTWDDTWYPNMITQRSHKLLLRPALRKWVKIMQRYFRRNFLFSHKIPIWFYQRQNRDFLLKYGFCCGARVGPPSDFGKNKNARRKIRKHLKNAQSISFPRDYRMFDEIFAKHFVNCWNVIFVGLLKNLEIFSGVRALHLMLSHTTNCPRPTFRLSSFLFKQLCLN